MLFLRNALYVLALSLAGCTTASSQEGVRQIDVATLQVDLERRAVPLLIDVRTPAEFAQGHVPGAKNIPLDQLETRVNELGDPAAEVYVICQSGARSSRASTLLAAKGFHPVDIAGGTAGWRSAGRPVE